MKKGLIHIYTGEGKGKTTAAFGLAMRACGRGMQVCVFQFLKGMGSPSGEAEAANNLRKNLKVIRFAQIHPRFLHPALKGEHSAKLKAQLKEDLSAIKKEIRGKKYGLIILDEILCCVAGKFLGEKQVLEIIKNKPAGAELVLTGRGATKRLIACADYVTEMKLIKHPYKKGIKARRGIEC